MFSPWGHKESDVTEPPSLYISKFQFHIRKYSADFLLKKSCRLVLIAMLLSMSQFPCSWLFLRDFLNLLLLFWVDNLSLQLFCTNEITYFIIL